MRWGDDRRLLFFYMYINIKSRGRVVVRCIVYNNKRVGGGGSLKILCIKYG